MSKKLTIKIKALYALYTVSNAQAAWVRPEAIRITLPRMLWTNHTGATPCASSAVSEATSLRRSTVYKCIAERTFPKAVLLGGGRLAWVEQEIQDWIAE
ncbi:AlpA family phage regulatory protein [Paraburkholderia caledonica]|uniref:AlpA family phage regulatory protein n=1 Tax=Paraburkholderia caledonica TaxID=134536 RepID=UPI0038BCAF30